MAVAYDLTHARTSDNTQPYLGKRLLAVTTPDFDFCTRLIDGTFPIYKSQILPASQNAVTYSRSELLAALHRLSAVRNVGPPPLVALSWCGEGRLCVVLARQSDDGSDMIGAQATGAARIAAPLRQIVGLIGNLGCEGLRLKAGAEDLINSEQFWVERKRQSFGQADIDEWCDEYHRKTGAGAASAWPRTPPPRSTKQRKEKAMTEKELNQFVGGKMKLLGIRARDPNHPMHNIIQWSANGLPIMPDDDEELARLILAALDEPDPS